MSDDKFCAKCTGFDAPMVEVRKQWLCHLCAEWDISHVRGQRAASRDKIERLNQQLLIANTEIEIYCASIAELKEQRDALVEENLRLLNLTKSLDRLLACYRTGKRPSDKLLDDIKRFRGHESSVPKKAGR